MHLFPYICQLLFLKNNILFYQFSIQKQQIQPSHSSFMNIFILSKKFQPPLRLPLFRKHPTFSYPPSKIHSFPLLFLGS